MDQLIRRYTKVFILLSIFLAPIIYLIIFFRKKKKSNKNILVVPQFKRIGDIICSTPVFKAIKEKYPESRITIITSIMAVGILKNNPRIDDLIVVEDYRDNFWGLIKKIRENYFDIGVSLSGTALSSTLFFLGFIPKRLKITRSNRPLAELLSDWMSNMHQDYSSLSYLPLFYLRMLRQIGIASNDDKKEIFIDKNAEENIIRLLGKAGVQPQDKLIGISVTAGNRIKEWGDGKFEILARKINEKYKTKVVFIGSPFDRSRADTLTQKLGDPENFINMAGCSLEELSPLMKRFKIFISVDTGPTHIAHALALPLIDILGPVNPTELTPSGENIRIIKPATSIAPTIFAFQNPGPEHLTKEALDNITVDQVFATFEELYSKIKV